MRLDHHETDRAESTTSTRLYLYEGMYHVVTEYDSATAYYRLAKDVADTEIAARTIYARHIRDYHPKGAKSA